MHVARLFTVFSFCERNLSVCSKRGLRTQRSSILKWLSAARKTLRSNENTEKIVEFKDSEYRARRCRSFEIVPTRGDRSQIITNENQFKNLSETVTPLASLNYEDQLRLKYRQNREILKELGKRLKDVKSPVKRDGTGLPCKLKNIIPSPVTVHYRNKDEFRIKPGHDRNPKTVGFLVGSLSKGTAVCVNPIDLINIRPAHVKICMSFQHYIRKSELHMCDLFHDGGHWRGITVRSNSFRDLMAIVVLHPQQLTEEELSTERALLKNFFLSGDGKDCGLKSLYFQACRHSRCTSELAPFDLLFGEKHLYEEILGLKFRISPDAFFQTNTLGAECLYKALLELSDIDEHTIVLDICSGTGTISLIMAKHARAVIGIETVKQAVEDAQANAELNGIGNAVFQHGRAEFVLPKLLKNMDLKGRKVIAVVNPTRAGLHPKVLRTLRSCEEIEKLIYISCLPQGEAMNNLVYLGSPNTANKTKGRPFIPKIAVPMDMFPQTEHCELIIVLERSPISSTKHGLKSMK